METDMTASNIVLTVDVRERTGRGGARETRRADLVPGVLYGGDRAPVAISVDKKTIKAALKSGKFLSHTVTLEYKGERQLVFAQDIQFHPVTDEPTHLDLYRVEKGQVIRVAVPVKIIGQGSLRASSAGAHLTSCVTRSGFTRPPTRSRRSS